MLQIDMRSVNKGLIEELIKIFQAFYVRYPKIISKTSIPQKTTLNPITSVSNTAIKSSELKSSVKSVVTTVSKISQSVDCLQYEKLGYKEQTVYSDSLLPPLLVSFPGMGRTFLRALIEYATGIYTGSLDAVTMDAFLADKYCGFRMILIDSEDHEYFQADEKGSIRLQWRKHQNRCKRGGIHGFKRIVILLANPFHSAVLEMAEEMTSENSKDIGSQYQTAYLNNISPMIRNLAGNQGLLHVVRFEDLMNDMRRLDALAKLVTFITGGDAPNPERLHCAFELAYKRIDMSSVDEAIKRASSADSDVMTTLLDRISTYATEYQYSVPNRNAVSLLKKHVSPFQITQNSIPISSVRHVKIKPKPSSINSEKESVDSANDPLVDETEEVVPMQNILQDSVQRRSKIYNVEKHTLHTPVIANVSKSLDCSRHNTLQLKQKLEDETAPPILMSFPGLGHSYVRSLIEYASGIYSGSFVASTSGDFQYDGRCDSRLIIISCESSKYIHVTGKGSISILSKKGRSRCRSGMINEFSKILLLIGNPIHAVYNSVMKGDQSVEVIEKSALNLAKSYQDEYSSVISSMLKGAHYKTGSLLLVKIEDLLSKSKRFDTLLQVISFISPNNVNEEKIICAFELVKPSEELNEQILVKYKSRLLERMPALDTKIKLMLHSGHS
jgi:hypothetical protein